MILRTFVSFALVGIVGVASANSLYLALGDSVAFGYQDGDITPSYGVQGYVDDVAAALNAQTGVAHQVLNLAVPQETSVSFGNTDVVGGRLINYNYQADLLAGRPVSQLDSMRSSIATNKASGNTIDAVSFAIGANDLLNLTNGGTTTPSQQDIDAAFANVQSRYVSVLGYLRTELPSATILLPGYYNPMPPSTTQGAQLDPLLRRFNTSVQALASTYHARYVDFYTPIDGHQAEWILPGIHPNGDGYAALGRAAAQAVPEPGSYAVLGLGAMALLRRRRR